VPHGAVRQTLAGLRQFPSLIIADNAPLLHAIAMPVAETLGVVSSIISIVQISQEIISLCQFYIDAVNGTSSDLRAILIEVSTLEGIAKSLQYLTQPNVTNSVLLNQLAAVTGPIEGCKKALKELETLFPPAVLAPNGQRSKRLDAAIATLAWPLKRGKAKKLLQEIMQHKTTISLALTAEFVYVSILCPFVGSWSDLLYSHDLKDVRQKTEQIQNLLTRKNRFLTRGLSLSRDRKRS
jgi:Fungal N-terminal domain of STAND proteins